VSYQRFRVVVDDGFSLVELALVILIIGLLLAMALPTFLSVRAGAQHELARSSLHTAETEANLIYEEGETYNVPVSRLISAEPGLSFVQSSSLGPSAASDGPTSVVYFGDATNFGAVANSRGGRCYLVTDVEGERRESYYRASGDGIACSLPASLLTPGHDWTRVA
jgi:type IV pilus assembly protein PilA